MATNKVQDGMVLTLVAPSGGVVSGLTYKIGSLVVVAMGTAAEAASFAAATEGVFTLVKTASQVWTPGQKLYWDNSGAAWTNIPAAGALFSGFAVADAISAAVTGNVLINPAMTGTAQAATVAAVATADGSDAATTQALANALKVSHNAVLASLKAAGLMA